MELDYCGNGLPETFGRIEGKTYNWIESRTYKVTRITKRIKTYKVTRISTIIINKKVIRTNTKTTINKLIQFIQLIDQ